MESRSDILIPFKEADDKLLKFLLTTLSLRLRFDLLKKYKASKAGKMNNIVHFTSAISTARTFDSFYESVKIWMPKITHYADACILYYDCLSKK